MPNINYHQENITKDACLSLSLSVRPLPKLVSQRCTYGCNSFPFLSRSRARFSSKEKPQSYYHHYSRLDVFIQYSFCLFLVNLGEDEFVRTVRLPLSLWTGRKVISSLSDRWSGKKTLDSASSDFQSWPKRFDEDPLARRQLSPCSSLRRGE